MQGVWSLAPGAKRRKLLTTFVARGAAQHWRTMHVDRPAPIQGALANMLRRRWGICALRENARLLLTRLTYVGRDAAAAARRRQLTSEAFLAQARVGAIEWRPPLLEKR